MANNGTTASYQAVASGGLFGFLQRLFVARGLDEVFSG